MRTNRKWFHFATRSRWLALYTGPDGEVKDKNSRLAGAVRRLSLTVGASLLREEIQAPWGS